MFAFYSFKLSVGNNMSRTESRGCLFVPAASCTRSSTGKAQPQRTKTRQVGRTCWAAWGPRPAGMEEACPVHYHPTAEQCQWEWSLAGGLACFPAPWGALLSCLASEHGGPPWHRATTGSPRSRSEGVCRPCVHRTHGWSVSPVQRVSRARMEALHSPALLSSFHGFGFSNKCS